MGKWPWWKERLARLAMAKEKKLGQFLTTAEGKESIREDGFGSEDKF